jgi:gliding motility-associated-like protein
MKLREGLIFFFLLVIVKSGISQNLLLNGNFSLGNTNVSTSYQYCNSANCLVPLINNGYSIGPNPAFFHPIYTGHDHTTGTGNMMIVNGGLPNDIVWIQMVNVFPQHTYSFSAWACAIYTVNPANLEVSINGVVVATITTNNPVNIWDQLSATWNSGSSFSALISIRVTNLTGANNGVDFGLDDISFACGDCNPTSQFSASSTTICVGQSVNFNVLSPGLYTYLWNFGDLTTSTQLSPTHTFTAANVYNVTLQCSNALVAVTSIVKVTVLPYPTLVVAGNTLICSGNTASLTASGATSYSWSNGNTSPTVGLNPSATSTYSLLGANGTCSNSAIVTVSVNPSPAITSLDVKKASCGLNDGTATIFADPPTSSVLWSNGQTGNAVGNLPPGNYTVNVSTPYCSTQTTLTIDALIITISSSLIIPSGCEDDGEFIIKELQGGRSPYLVNFNHTGYNSESAFTKLKAGMYPLQIIDVNNCKNDFSILIPANEDGNAYIPNAFTPNNDDVNDVWSVVCTCVRSYRCSIFNRWGTKMIELTNINEGWNGTYKGEIVPDGVYVYKLELETYNDKNIKRSGHINISK